MPLILCLETSTKSCSVALSENGKLLAIKESTDYNYSHSENLTPYIEDVLQQAKIKIQQLNAVAVSKGPGSYTGLRIGVSTAKGLCYALNIPLIAINSLEAMAVQVLSLKSIVFSQNQTGSRLKTQDSRLFIPMIDAKRMEVYCSVYNEKGEEIFPTSAEIIDENYISKISSHLPPNSQLPTMYFFGDGAEKCKSTITHPNAIFIDNVHASAKSMIPIAEKYFTEKRFEDVAYFEPFYLKDFIGTKLMK